MALSEEQAASRPDDRDVVMEVRNAEVTFDMDRGDSRVLDDVSFDIERDEILGVVGESGSGKSIFASTLLDDVVDPGVLQGDVIYHRENGESINILELSDEDLRAVRWEEISMVFQGAMSSFNPTMTIRKHFEVTLNAHDHDLDEGLAHARELLEDLYVDPDRVLDSYAHELSGGMKQRALIALSLVLEPEVLVMDEPTAALDLLMQRSILSLLEDIQEKYDLTVVFITHDLPLVAGLADRLAVMYAFELVEYGPADEIIEFPSHPYTRALLQAVPNLDSPLSEMRPIEGAAPDPVNVPDGCSYEPRCPMATEQCRASDPEFEQVDDDHEAACFHWEDAREEIDLSVHGETDANLTPTSSPTQDGDVVVSLDDINVHFDKEETGLLNFFDEPERVRAVDGVSLDIHENDVVVLVGESGCGKTTLGKSAIGVQRPTEGTVSYRGQDIWVARDGAADVDIPFEQIRRSLQIIHQDPGSSLNPNRTVKASLEMPLKRWYSEADAPERQEKIYGMLERVGMEPARDYANRFPHQLSGGEKQRVALIRALLMNPDLILADEAVSALDVSLRVEVMDLMLELQELFDTSFLFISHNLSNARYLAGKAGGRIGVMYMGEIVEIGPAEQIINDPQHPYTKVLKWSTADLEVDQEAADPPIRTVDVPDATNPPSGCRFHTRCPVARETCRKQNPDLADEDGHATACFRTDTNHPYWDSEPIDDDYDDETVFES